MKSRSALSPARIVNATRYSMQGLAAACRDEAAFRQELMLFAVLAPLTLWLGLPVLHTVVLGVLMGSVLALELLNSGLEALVDLASPDKHPLAGKAKDCGSAAVLVAMLAFLASWLALAGPALWLRLSS